MCTRKFLQNILELRGVRQSVYPDVSILSLIKKSYLIKDIFSGTRKILNNLSMKDHLTINLFISFFVSVAFFRIKQIIINNSHIPNCNGNCLNRIEEYVFANHSQKEGLHNRLFKLVFIK